MIQDKAIDSYTTTEGVKTRRITRLLLSRGENKSLDLTVIGSIKTPITKTNKIYIYSKHNISCKYSEHSEGWK